MIRLRFLARVLKVMPSFFLLGMVKRERRHRSERKDCYKKGARTRSFRRFPDFSRWQTMLLLGKDF